LRAFIDSCTSLQNAAFCEPSLCQPRETKARATYHRARRSP
jgi:hypothetical protein